MAIQTSAIAHRKTAVIGHRNCNQWDASPASDGSVTLSVLAGWKIANENKLSRNDVAASANATGNSGNLSLKSNAYHSGA
jgi:hypothetical protein